MSIFKKLFGSGKSQQIPEYFNIFPKELRELILNEINGNPQVCELDEIPQGVGEFGLEITNPVPTYGTPSNEIYLDRLLFTNGTKPKWRRIGSTETFSITKAIDMYEIFDQQGETVCTMYISPYHRKISNKVPKGFKRR